MNDSIVNDERNPKMCTALKLVKSVKGVSYTREVKLKNYSNCAVSDSACVVDRDSEQ